jgi:acyl-CoA thioester hydrolase
VKSRPGPSAVSIDLEIPFHDVDILNVVWHGHYCKYLELGRTALLRARRLDVADMIELGFRFYVGETRIRHVYPLQYADRLRVTSWFTEVENRIGISYVLENVTAGKRAAIGLTHLVTTDAANALCFETPGPILARLRGSGPGAVEEPRS